MQTKANERSPLTRIAKTNAKELKLKRPRKPILIRMPIHWDFHTLGMGIDTVENRMLIFCIIKHVFPISLNNLILLHISPKG